MPEASTQLRDKMKYMFNDSINDDGPVRFLEQAGYALTADWTWKKDDVTELWQMTSDEFACLQFLVDEWDYGGLEEISPRRNAVDEDKEIEK